MKYTPRLEVILKELNLSIPYFRMIYCTILYTFSTISCKQWAANSVMVAGYLVGPVGDGISKGRCTDVCSKSFATLSLALNSPGYTALSYTTVHLITLHCTALDFTSPHWTSGHYTILHCIAMHCTKLCCTSLLWQN